MTVSINWTTQVISIPRADMPVVQVTPEVRELDIRWLKDQLKLLEESTEGIIYPDTHNHIPETTMSGVVFASMIEIINGYTITFENAHYAVNIFGGNSNLGDVINRNDVSFQTQNSAGMIIVTSGSGLSQTEHDKVMSIPTAPDNADAVWHYERV